MDPVLEVTRRARARYAASPTDEIYIGYPDDGTCHVCAVGAIWAEQITCAADVSMVVTGHPTWQIMEDLPEAESEALRLLDATAVELVPESEHFGPSHAGPLEYVNQHYHPGDLRWSDEHLWEKLWEARKEMVLRIYDLGIARREAEARADEILGEVVREANRETVAV